MKKNGKVFVGLSGGVDSSVAALRLLREGYDVTGVFIKVWQPDFLSCNWEAERLDAMRVAAHLEIPFLTCDAEKEYRENVGEYFIREYEAGRTPNPDVLCNQFVKFGAFLEFAKKHGADFVATGHYAQKQTNGKVTLHRGLDTKKDQTYFLWSLNQEQLNQILFPIGNSTKTTIRKEAKAAKLPTALKKDSQGVCFLGHIDIPEFLSYFLDLEEGDVLNRKGEVIGKHKGALVYTVGQRHGFSISANSEKTLPHYVRDRNLEQNSITVSTKKPSIQPGECFVLTNVNLISNLEVGDNVEAQFRYRQTPFIVEVISKHKESITIKPLQIINKPATGQSCVLYKASKCLGGGIIK